MKSCAVELGEAMAMTRRFSCDEVSQFARLAGDENPIHHDLQAANDASFERQVVSGPQLSSLLMGMTATHFSKPGAKRNGRSMLGLDFRFRFHKAVLADEELKFHWQVVSVRPKPSMGGDLVFLAGRINNSAGQAAVKAVGKVLVR